MQQSLTNVLWFELLCGDINDKARNQSERKSQRNVARSYSTPLFYLLKLPAPQWGWTNYFIKYVLKGKLRIKMLQDVSSTKRKLEFHKTRLSFVEFRFAFRGIKFAFCGIKFASKESSWCKRLWALSYTVQTVTFKNYFRSCKAFVIETNCFFPRI